jgi:hypothetical protein
MRKLTVGLLLTCGLVGVVAVVQHLGGAFSRGNVPGKVGATAQPSESALARSGLGPPGPRFHRPAPSPSPDDQRTIIDDRPDSSDAVGGGSVHDQDRGPISANAEDHKAFLQVEFDRQLHDPAWAHSSERGLRSGIGSVLVGKNVGTAEVDCRSSLCRISIPCDTVGDADDARAALIHSGIWTGPGFWTRGPNEETVLIFLAREGTDLPDG